MCCKGPIVKDMEFGILESTNFRISFDVPLNVLYNDQLGSWAIYLFWVLVILQGFKLLSHVIGYIPCSISWRGEWERGMFAFGQVVPEEISSFSISVLFSVSPYKKEFHGICFLLLTVWRTLVPDEHLGASDKKVSLIT